MKLSYNHWTCETTRLVVSQVLHFIGQSPIKVLFYKEVALKLKFPNNSIIKFRTLFNSDNIIPANLII
jgi:hypothetical protein